jgi:Spy/CpxP family protein refolding chaperone
MITPPRAAALAALALALAAATPAVATEPSPYAGLERRGVKALSEAEVGDLLAGRGAGMALPAELNRYPGPVHVLELAGTLRLTPEQEAETRRLLAEMRSDAIPLGQAVVAEETELDRLFASGAADEASLRPLVAEIARLRGELRLAHLKYHLTMRNLLSPVQVAAYDAARGYGAAAGAGGHGAGGHGGGGGMHHPR